MTRIKLLLLIIGLAVIIVSDIWRLYYANKPFRLTENDLLQVLPKSHYFEESSINSLKFIKGYKEKGGQMNGIAYITTQIEPAIIGYSDQITVLAGMDLNGNITGIKLLYHKETPAYMKSIQETEFFSLFMGLDIAKGFRDSEVDTVSGATISSQAIIDDLRESSLRIAKEVIGLPVSLNKEDRSVFNEIFTPNILMYISMFILCLFAISFANNKLLKYIVMVYAFIILGIVSNTLLYIGNLSSLLQLDFPPLTNIKLVILIMFVLLTTPFLGQVYCTYLCPFGTLQEFLYKTIPGRLHVPLTVVKRYINLRFFVLFVVIIMYFGGNLEIFLQLEPFPYLFSWLKGSGIGLVWLLIFLVLAASASFYRFYCRIFCPTGTCLYIIASLPWKKARISAGSFDNEA